MRWIKLSLALLRAKFKSKIDPTESIMLTFRVWLTDIDVSLMNHASILTVMETGRIDFMVRTGFFRLASKNGWYFPSQAISVQYFRPLKAFQKAELYTRISYMDDEWIYLEQKIMRKTKEVSACIVKSKIKKGKETVATSEIIKALGADTFQTEKYDLISTYELENVQMKSRIIDHWIT